MAKLNDAGDDADELFHKFGPIKLNASKFMRGQYHIYKTVWPEAAKMRETGTLY